MLVGAAGAAMGARAESEQIKTMHHDLQTAVKVENRGQRQRDYQTVEVFKGIDQTTEQGIMRKSQDRAELLSAFRARGKTEHKLTDRYFLTDAVYTVAYRSDGAVDLSDLCHRFRKPVFPVFLGRKQFLPAVDFMPEIVEAASFQEALLSRNSLEVIQQQMPEGMTPWFDTCTNTRVLMALPERSGNADEWEIVRNDFCFDPALRAFGARKEFRSYVEVGE